MAQQDAALTHPHRVCLQANALFAMAIADAIGGGKGAQDLHRRIQNWAAEMKVDAALMKIITAASIAPPPEYIRQQGWVLRSVPKRIVATSCAKP